MARIRALQDYVGRRKGEEFDASDEDARILCAPDLPGGQKCERLELEPRAMTATDSPLVTESRRGRYQRRDMRARE